MTQPRGRVLPVLLAALVLLAGANLAAYAATEGPLLLGRANTASKATALKVTGAGPALSLRSRPGSPPLAVSSTKKVARLNADRLDGLEGAALQTKAYRYRLPASGAAAGIVAGALTATLPTLRRLVDPSLQALRAVPSLAWVPLFILWFGIFEASKVALIAVGTFFPVYLGVAGAILSAGLVPIVEPEVDIHSPQKAAAEKLLKDALLTRLDQLAEDQDVALILAITVCVDAMSRG